MPILDITEFDFSQEHARDNGQVARRVAVVRKIRMRGRCCTSG